MDRDLDAAVNLAVRGEKQYNPDPDPEARGRAVGDVHIAPRQARVRTAPAERNLAWMKGEPRLPPTRQEGTSEKDSVRQPQSCQTRCDSMRSVCCPVSVNLIRDLGV